MQPEPIARLLRPREVAEALGTSVDWVLRHSTHRGGRIPSITFTESGKRGLVRYSPETLRKLMEVGR